MSDKQITIKGDEINKVTDMIRVLTEGKEEADSVALYVSAYVFISYALGQDMPLSATIALAAQIYVDVQSGKLGGEKVTREEMEGKIHGH